MFQMKIFFIYFFILFSFLEGKSIEDPVARHDANECGTYLCPSMSLYATKYLQSGCETEFQIFVKELFQKNESMMLFSKDNNEDNNGSSVNNSVFILLCISSGVFSLLLGYIVGKYN